MNAAMKFLGLGLAVVGISPARAADMKCDVQDAMRCPCPASLRVSCEGYGRSGYVANGQKVKSVTLSVTSAFGTTKSVTITNPQQSVRSYYAASSNDEVKKELMRSGLTLKDGDRVKFSTFVADSNIPLYQGPGPSLGSLDGVPIVPRESSAGDATAQCTYLKPPHLVTAAACGSSKLCVAELNCGGQTTLAACEARGSSCPTADECAEDPKVTFSEPTIGTAGGTRGGAVSGSGSRNSNSAR